MKRRCGRAFRAVLAGAAAMCAVAAPPGRAWAAGEPAPYTFAEDSRRIEGAAITRDAPRLAADTVYRDTIGKGGKLVYRLDLDASTHAYVSAVAVPRPDSRVSFQDGVEVSLQDRDGRDCSSDQARFGSAEFPLPLVASAHRTLEKGGTSCQEAGSYYVVVERTGKDTSSAEPWDLELRHVREPGLRTAGPTSVPGDWPSASPAPPAGEPRERAGGAGFSDAPGLTEGEWTDRIEPGQSRFYRVPVDWGQQAFVSADLSSASGDGFVTGAMTVALYNPALALVSSTDSVAYDGRQKSAALEPMPPVRYENRFDPSRALENTRFAGWYYLRVGLNPEVGAEFGRKPYGLTLRISVEGEPQAEPAYDGPAGIFTVTRDDEAAAAEGRSGPEAAGSGTMRLVAVAGIGTGTALVLGLGVWTLLARRRAARSAARTGEEPAQYGPPTAW